MKKKFESTGKALEYVFESKTPEEYTTRAEEYNSQLARLKQYTILSTAELEQLKIVEALLVTAGNKATE